MVENTKHSENENDLKSELEEEKAGESEKEKEIKAGTDSSDEKDFDGEEKRNENRRKSTRRKKEDIEKETVINDLKNEINKKNEEVDSLKDLLLRRQADFENYKKRNAKLQEDFKKHVIKNFAFDIILTNDDLLRAIEASENVHEGESIEEAHKSFVMGVSMVSKRIEETLEKYGVVEVESLGGEFDPNFHEAVEIEMNDSVTVDTVAKVHQKGFKIGDMVVRSAKVKVAKPAKPEAVQTGESNKSTDKPLDSEEKNSEKG